MAPILFHIRFCRKILHVFCLDLLKLISRKAWLMMLAVKINKYTKQRLPAFSVPSLKVFTLCFMLLNFYYFLNRIKELKTFFSPHLCFLDLANNNKLKC